MQKRLLRPLGFLLAFSALIAFVLHPNHNLLNKDPDSSSHCCVCHTVPMGAARPQVEQTPVQFLVYDVTVAAQARPFSVFFSPESPRGPPVA